MYPFIHSWIYFQ